MTPTEQGGWDERARGDDPALRERFVTSQLDLVRYEALRIASRLPSSVEADDLVHDGVVGLLDAVERYDPARGVHFRAYAGARVRGAILDGLRRRDWRPRSVRAGAREIEATLMRLGTATGRAATEEEAAEAMGLDLGSYRRLLGDVAAGPLLPLDDMPAGQEPQTAEAKGADQRLERRELLAALAEELVNLPPRELRILELYYHEGLNMKEVGAVLGVTESRVCQLHAQAGARLRAALRRRFCVAAGAAR